MDEFNVVRTHGDELMREAERIRVAGEARRARRRRKWLRGGER
jgi:hypothetical protein